MKRNFLKLMMLVGIVALSSQAFAQETSPIVGASYDYSVNGLTNGDGYAFSINTSTTTAGGTTSATFNSGQSGTVSGGSTSTASITWNDTGTYNLWIEVTGTSTNSCTNRRYVPVTPTANVFDISLIALGTSTSTEYPSWESAGSNASDCHVYATGYDFESTGGDSDGSSYAFFRIDVVDINDNTASGEWNFTLSEDAAGTIEYYVSSSWTTTKPTDIAGNISELLIRVTETNNTAGTTFNFSVDGTENVGTSTVDDLTTGNDAATFTIESYPDLDNATITWN
jgi:hypothetical protein